MKKKFRTFIPTILLFAMIIGFVPATATTPDAIGMDFKNLFNYDTAAQTFPLPSTFEATIKLPAKLSGRGGVIVGNYNGEQKAIFNMEIHENGVPRLYINAKDSAGNVVNYDIKFSKVNVATGFSVHLAITMDRAAGTWTCYVNGEAKQTIQKTVPQPFEMTEKIRLGGDFRSGNGQYFKGTIENLALYSDVRTPQEIANDASGAIATDGLICGYDLTGNTLGNYPEKIPSLSGAAFDLTSQSDWIQTIAEPKDYAYSFAVIGDIQTLTYSYPQQLTSLYGWIRDNAESKKIKYAIGLGDITEKNTIAEYDRVKQAYALIDGVVPFSIIRGNHDRAGLSSSVFDANITKALYADEITGAFDDTMRNTYRILQVGQVKYLFMNLDYLLLDPVLEWANKVISENKDCHVIVSTHIYMSQTGSYYKLDTSSGIGTKYGCQNNGQGLWDKLLSQHENIVMLLCGHNPTDDIFYRQKEGIHGNKVTEMLIDPQTTDKTYGGTGLIAMFYFSQDGKQLQVQYYSVSKDAYFKSNNQFTLTLDIPTEAVQPTTAPTAVPTAAPTQSATQPTVPAPVDAPDNGISPILIAVVISALIVTGVVVFFVTQRKKVA